MRALDFFFALRPLVLIPAWSFFLLGHGLAATAAFPALRFVLTSLVLAAVHLVNQVADTESDRINTKGFFLQRGIFSRRTYAAWAISALFLSLAAAFIWRETPLWLAGAAALGLAYSLPPLRLCGRPGLDVLANALGYGALAVLLGAGAREFPHAAVRLAASALAVAAVFLHTTLLDLAGDRRTGKRTTGVFLGAPHTRAAAAILALGGAATAAAAAAPVLLGATAALAALCALAWMRPGWIGSSAVGVGGTALFALAAGVFVPLFPAALVLLVVSTRLYYRRRFALAYPSLRPSAQATER